MPVGATTRSQGRPRVTSQPRMSASPIVAKLKERWTSTLAAHPLKGVAGGRKRSGSKVYVELPLRPTKKRRLSEPSTASSSSSVSGPTIKKPKYFYASEETVALKTTDRLQAKNLASREAAFKLYLKNGNDEIKRRRREAERDQEDLARQRMEMEEEKTKLRKARTELKNAKKDMSMRQQELERREADEKKFAEHSALLGELFGATASAEGIVNHLEEFFECPLCLDIIATPYSIGAYKCGHTFCALCLLKWFFATLHDCGDWHQPVTCPLCRAVPIMTAPVVNLNQTRAEWTFPFLPARIVDSLLEDSVRKLHNMSAAVSGALQTVDELSNRTSSQKKRKKKCAHVPALEPALEEWGDGGSRREDWSERKARGRVEMDRLTESWAVFSPADCLNMKARLGV